MDVFTVVGLAGVTAGFLVYLGAAATGHDRQLHDASARRAGRVYGVLFVIAAAVAFAWLTFEGASWAERIISGVLAGLLGAFEGMVYFVGIDYVTPDRPSGDNSRRSAGDG